ncbi:unnamed protein product [Arctia plantaginis]|uniref:Structural maintenance of chromosomes protein 5 n=1 Tax=Arctia plantaginis TaxID=874455 RepID=A0A8S0Z2L3_ARCPL|nr:unnamed protein product [Arctia plantaginis]
MSRVVNYDGVKAGCIYRIALENFVTYRRVQLFPGLSLNLIIGPNGTGKSTFVCAIILGLCGKPSVIGRSKKISDYVRTGCSNSTIEIELYRDRGQRNVIITRNFNLLDVSTWSIDHKTVREKQVQEIIASMNIQVDNLCQLLPQDRVQDFTKMDNHEILRSTLSAVGGQESVQMLNELIECRTLQRRNVTTLQSNAQVIEEQKRLNERLKVVIDAMKQRKEIEKQIEICEKKKLFLEYQELREKYVEYCNDKKEAVKVVKTHQQQLEPLKRVMDTAKVEISKLEKETLDKNRKIYSYKESAKEILTTIRTQEFHLKEIESSFQEKMERHRNKERELQEARAKLDKLNMDKTSLVEKVGDETKVKMELAEFHKHISQTNGAIEVLKKQKLELQHDIEMNINPHIRLCQNRIRNLEDVNIKRLETLRAYSEDCYNAVLWLRENRHLFQHDVHEPMMLEINFTDPKFARYLESTVAGRDLVAFTFESSQDMNLFLQKVRQEKGLKRVNALCSQGGSFELPERNIQQLSYLGFYTYLVDTISAPDAIVRYLCKTYKIHAIPIGNDHTYNNSGNVPANITLFFTENHRFQVRVSAYSGEKSSSTIEIRQPKLMANTVDAEQVDKLKAESVLKQYLPMKPIKRGYKLWCLADQRGYIKKFQIYQGKDEELNSKFTGYGLGEKVVLELTEQDWGKGKVVYFDNFFSSVALLEKLKTENTYACGTIRSNRKGLPGNMLSDSQMKRGNSDYRFSSLDIGYWKWKDNKVVHLVSNFHGNQEATVSRKEKNGSKSAIICPMAVKDYNSYMGGVDTADRLRALYCIDRKSPKWWHRKMKYERAAQNKTSKMNDLDSKLSRLESNLNELNMQRKGISEGVEKVRTISAQIRIQAKKVQDIENEPTFDIQQAKETSKRKQKECVTKQCKLQVELKGIIGDLHSEILNGDVLKLKLNLSRNSIVEQETQLRELTSDLKRVEATLQNIEALLVRAKSAAKEKLIEAKRSSDNKLPGEEGFPYSEQFELLPNDVTALQERCYELQTSIDCMDHGDDNVIKEYEDRERDINRLQTEVETSSDRNKLLETQMENIKSRWLPPLEALLRDIDKSFGDMFAKVGCAGEIKLEKGGSEEDFDKYGILILVRFRADEQLAPLTRHAQSGGERALSTALYLLALQRQATVPFRCVDEINQGMDPINERKMFELLVKVITECDNSQYFLLTPKLLTNLEYNDKIMVHTIMNGQKIMDNKKWNHIMFIEKANVYRASTS